MSPVLVTREELEKRSLAHYRTPGSKNGERRYQYEDGSLTPLGRIHYGVGLGRDRKSGGAVTMLVGKKQVNKDGSLTKTGIKKVEESSKNGYLNPTNKERKKGLTTERDKISKEYSEEYWKAVEKGMSKNEPSEKDKNLWNKYKDAYAEATLKDLKLPVNEKNKGVVKDTFTKYDAHYEYKDPTDPNYEEYHNKIEENWNKRFRKNLDEKANKEIKKDVESKIEDFNKNVKEKKDERTAANKERNDKLKEEIKEIRSLADDELNKRIDRLQREKQYAELLNERNSREQSELHRRASKIFKDAAENLARKALNTATDELLKKYRDQMNEVKQKQQNQQNQEKKDDGSKSSDNSSKSNNGKSEKFSKPEKSQIRSMAGAGKSVAEIAKALGTTEEKVKSYMSAASITIS